VALRQRTLLILGAGSSRDFDFPLGPDLTQRIADAVTFDLSGFKPSGGHPTIGARLEHMRFHQPEVFNHWVTACEYIRRNIHLASSVDRFIESNRDDQNVVTLCKFAVALIIADCERKSPFGRANDEVRTYFDFGQLKNVWATKFFHHLHAGVARAELNDIFSNVRVVTFNYDRVLECFLKTSIENFYRLTAPEAQKVVDSLELVHVYGSLGSLSRDQPNFRPFGVFGNNPQDACTSIQTFHESVASATAVKVGDYMRWAERVFVLGFSYADMNTGFFARCEPDLKRIKPVFGTCLNMSEQNIATARARMDGIFALQNASTRMLNVNCSDFFDDLALTM
jgi:hypothetical protein